MKVSDLRLGARLEAMETPISLHSFFCGGRVWNIECVASTTLSLLVHTKIIKKQTLNNLEFSREL